MSNDKIELAAYMTFFVFVLLLTPLAFTWISAGFGSASHDSVGGGFMMLFMMLPVVVIVFSIASILSLICIITGTRRLRLRLFTLWASIILPYMTAYVPPPEMASVIGIIGFGLALSLPIIWSANRTKWPDSIDPTKKE